MTQYNSIVTISSIKLANLFPGRTILLLLCTDTLCLFGYYPISVESLFVIVINE